MFKSKGIMFLALVFALLTLSCTDPESDQPVLKADMPLHLEEHIDDARIEASAIPKNIPAPVEWNFSEPQPDWKTGSFLAGTRPATASQADDALRIILDSSNANPKKVEGGAFVNFPEWDHRDWANVIMQARSSGYGDIQLGFNIWDQMGKDEGWPYPHETISLTNDGAVHTYELQLKPSESWKGPIRQLGLRIMAKDPLEVDILSIAVVPLETLYAEERAGIHRVGYGGSYRSSLFAHTPARIDYRIQVPAEGRLDTAFGTYESPTTFRVKVRADSGEAETPLEESHDKRRFWLQKSIDLSVYAGQVITLSLEAESALEGSVALWGAPTLTGSPAQLSEAAAVGVDQTALDSYVRRVRSGEWGDQTSLLVMKDGRLILEEYFLGWGPQRRHAMASITKSFTSLMVGRAIQSGSIRSVDDPIGRYLPEYRHLLSGEKSKITIRHLLTMTSGISWNEWDPPYGNPENILVKLNRSDDPVAFFLSRPMAATPGSTWVYSGGGVTVLGEILRNATGQSDDQLIESTFAGLLAKDEIEWPRFRDGRLKTAGGFRLTPRDLINVGAMLLNHGSWAGKQIIDPLWIEESTRTIQELPGGWGWYGYLWWLNRLETKNAVHGVVKAAGDGGQRMLIIPTLNLVVVMTADNSHDQSYVPVMTQELLSALTGTAAIWVQPSQRDKLVGDPSPADEILR